LTDSFTLMWLVKVQSRADRHHTGRVDGVMTAVIVVLDVLHVDRLAHTGPLIKLTYVSPEVRVVDDPFQVALEVTVVDGIKSNQGREQTPVCLGDLVAQ